MEESNEAGAAFECDSDVEQRRTKRRRRIVLSRSRSRSPLASDAKAQVSLASDAKAQVRLASDAKAQVRLASDAKTQVSLARLQDEGLSPVDPIGRVDLGRSSTGMVTNSTDSDDEMRWCVFPLFFVLVCCRNFI
jgi:hypothetical protein